MATQVLETNVRQRDGMIVIDLRGEIDAFGEAALNSAYAEAKQLDASRILLNFKDVNYINSTGIALIVGLIAQARKAGHKLMVTGLSDHYREIFEVTRLSDFMTILPNEDAALKN
jgi:anti-anti-sigma factor